MMENGLDCLLFELRSARRSLLRKPRFLILSVFCLATGIGVGGLMLAIREVVSATAGAGSTNSLYPIMQGEIFATPTMSTSDFRSLDSPDFNTARLAAVTQVSASVVTWRDAAIEQVSAVSGRYFELLGVHAAMGRLLTSDDDRGGNRYAVLSNRFWKSRLGGDKDVIGREVTIAGRSFLVVGVAERNFSGFWPAHQSALWTPLSAAKGQEPQAVGKSTSLEVDVVMQVSTGATLEHAKAQLEAYSGRFNSASPLTDRRRRFWTVSKTIEALAPSSGPQTAIAAVAGLLVMITACVTVANLSLARSAQLSRELAIRRLLGAQRIRLVLGQLVASLIMVGFGGMLGWIFLSICLSAASVNVPVDNFVDLQVSFDHGISAIVAAGIGGVLMLVVGGLWPALRLTKKVGGDHANTGSSVSLRLTGIHTNLVAWQTAATVALVLLATLCVQTVDQRAIGRGWLGVERSAVALISFTSNGINTNEAIDTIGRLTGALDRASDSQSAGAFSVLPAGSAQQTAVRNPETGAQRRAAAFGLTNGGFQAISLRLVQGEWFSGSIYTSPKDAVISRQLAASLFRDVGQALGGAVELRGQRFTVVGVCETIGKDYEPALAVYVPIRHLYGGNAAIIVNGRTADSSLRDLNAELASIQPRLVPSMVRKGPAVVGRPFFWAKSIALAVALMATVTLILALIGLHGVLSYSVASRTAEIGIRIACGGTRRDIAKVFFIEGWRPILKGIAVGSAIAWSVPPLSRALTSVQVGQIGLGQTVLISLVVFVSATVACVLPAVQAARTNPAELLRQK